MALDPTTVILLLLLLAQPVSPIKIASSPQTAAILNLKFFHVIYSIQQEYSIILVPVNRMLKLNKKARFFNLAKIYLFSNILINV